MIELILLVVGFFVALWALAVVVGLCGAIWAWCRLSNAYGDAYHEASSLREPDK
jgi:hypothetical protein